jgi:hypothetical protein
MYRRMMVLTLLTTAFTASVTAQTATSVALNAQTFSDSPNTVSEYGLSWADFSGGTLGPSAMLSGFGGVNIYSGAARRLTVTAYGNVGIGTTAPAQRLQVNGGGEPSLGLQSNTQTLPALDNGVNATLVFETNYSGGMAEQDMIDTTVPLGAESAGFRFMQMTGPGTYRDLVYMSGEGNVGIGTTAPGAPLEVNGSVKLSANSGGSITFQDGTTQSTAYTGVICGGDYAESVDVAGDRKSYAPGDVLVIGADNESDVLKSAEPYSTLVAGIYSTKPGTVGRRQTTDAKASKAEIPMAMVGIVPTKVSAENGPIKRGDLLVTSSLPGYAMKGTDRSKMLGAVVGKALGNLDSGTGMIEVLVTLQ